MRRALGGLLLTARKVRAERCTQLYQTHPPVHIDHHLHHYDHQPHIPSFIRIHFCYTTAFASFSQADPHVITFGASSCHGLCAPSLDPTKIHDVKHEARDLSHSVAHCDTANEQNASEDSCRSMSGQGLSPHETRKLLKLMKIEDFKRHMYSTGKHCMPLEEVISLCKQMGTAMNDAEAEEILKSLDEAGSILIFRRKVFLEPEKVAELLSRSMPLTLSQEDDPRHQEFARLQKEKEEIDTIAHKQVRHMLWGAFAALAAQSGVFFRLTFWELSWDVMEPIAFFVTSSSLLAGFFFFVITKRDPSYHDFMDTLFSSKQRKLMKKRNFDIERFKELQVLCCLPPTSGPNLHMRLDAHHAR